MNGILKKSKVIQCNGCGGFVHEKSTTGCKVNLSRGNLRFYCAPCGEFAGTVREDANNINIAEFEIHENGAEDILEVEVEDDVGQAVPEDVVAAQEDEEDIVVEIQAHGAEDSLEDALAPDVPKEEENNDIDVVAAQEEEEDVVVEIQENGAEGIIEVEDAVAQAVPEEEENNDSDVVAAQEEEEEIVVELERETNHQILEEAENPNAAAEFEVSTQQGRTVMDESMMMSESCMTITSLNDTPTSPLAQSSIIDHVEIEDVATAIQNEKSFLVGQDVSDLDYPNAEDSIIENFDEEADYDGSEDLLNKSDSNMNIPKDTDNDKEVNEDDVDIPEDSFRLVLEDTIVQEDTPVQNITNRKRKLSVLHITISKELQLIRDIKGLSTRKKKCTRMRGFNINFNPNK